MWQICISRYIQRRKVTTKMWNKKNEEILRDAMRSGGQVGSAGEEVGGDGFAVAVGVGHQHGYGYNDGEDYNNCY